MTRILYIPTGECLTFLKDHSVSNSNSYTTVYENSLVVRSGKTPIEFIQYLICDDAEISFKNRNNIPVRGSIFKEEFEILYD